MNPHEEAAVANAHRLGSVHVDADAPPSHRFFAECACHAPDSNGEGRMDFHGDSADDVAALWVDHLEETLVAAQARADERGRMSASMPNLQQAPRPGWDKLRPGGRP